MGLDVDLNDGDDVPVVSVDDLRAAVSELAGAVSPTRELRARAELALFLVDAAGRAVLPGDAARVGAELRKEIEVLGANVDEDVASGADRVLGLVS